MKLLGTGCYGSEEFSSVGRLCRRAFLAENSRQYADYYNSLAIIAHLKGDVQNELSLYQKAVSYDFLYAAGHENISILYEEMQNDLKGALAEARIALEIDPTPFHISRVMLLYSEIGQPNEAKKYENQLLSMSNIDATFYNSLGLMYMDTNYSEAEQFLRKAIVADPTLPNPYNNLGIYYKGKKQYT